MYAVALRTKSGLTNLLPFMVGTLPEFTTPVFREVARADGAERLRARTFALNLDTTIRNIRPEGADVFELETLPVIVNGQVTFARPDRFDFQATKGQRIVICVWARALIPYISDAVPGWFQPVVTVRDAKGAEIAYCDDDAHHPDPLLAFDVPEDGVYSVEIKDAVARGREDFVYRMLIGAVPFATQVSPPAVQGGAESTLTLSGWNLPQTTLSYTPPKSTRGSVDVQPLGIFQKDLSVAVAPVRPLTQTASRTTLESVPAFVNGQLAANGETHRYVFHGKKGRRIVCEVLARRLNSPLDAYLRLTAPDGSEVAFSDDVYDKAEGLITHHADPRFIATLPQTGKYTLELGDTQGRGGDAYAYFLRITPPAPDFDLRLEPASLNAIAGCHTPFTVHLIRRGGFNGPVRVRLRNVPEGAKLSGGTIPAGADKAVMTLWIPSTASTMLRTARAEGVANFPNAKTPTMRPALACENRMQAFYIQHLVPYGGLALNVLSKKAQRGDPWARHFVAPVPEVSVIALPRGGETTVPLGTYEPPSGTIKLEAQLVNAPAAVSVVKTNLEGGKLSATLRVDAAQIDKLQNGNLVFELYATREVKGQKRVRQLRILLGTLPAIPYLLESPKPQAPAAAKRALPAIKKGAPAHKPSRGACVRCHTVEN